MKKIIISFIGIICLLIILNEFFTVNYKNQNLWIKKDRPFVIAHAGGRDLNPENTMKAFRHAFSIGVDVLEMDIMMTADSILVTHHGTNEDGNISLFSNGRGLVHEMTYDSLQAFNFGYKFQNLSGAFPYRNIPEDSITSLDLNIPRLEELFIEFGNKVKYMIEIKGSYKVWGDALVQVLLRLINEYELEKQVIIAAFDQKYLDAASRYALEVPFSASKSTTFNFFKKTAFQCSFLFDPKGSSALVLPLEWESDWIGTINLRRTYFIRKAHKMNMGIFYWTVNEKEDMVELIDMGVDGIITDRPDIMMEIISFNK